MLNMNDYTVMNERVMFDGRRTPIFIAMADASAVVHNYSQASSAACCLI